MAEDENVSPVKKTSEQARDRGELQPCHALPAFHCHSAVVFTQSLLALTANVDATFRELPDISRVRQPSVLERCGGTPK